MIKVITGDRDRRTVSRVQPPQRRRSHLRRESKLQTAAMIKVITGDRARRLKMTTHQNQLPMKT